VAFGCLSIVCNARISSSLNGGCARPAALSYWVSMQELINQMQIFGEEVTPKVR
jgi:hypothetical protein